jgi:phosphatidylserine/phosphatidylglycerophosphate/cardiolipin synthase-like enzyme
VQLLRTYPRRRHGYIFAPDGERSIARSYLKVLQRARSLIYIEDQYLWSPQVAKPFAEALAANPELCLIAVIPRFPDHDGRLSRPPSLVGHQLALEALYRGGGDRVAVYGIENHDGTPVYVHAKTCIVDDVWASVGSDNFNRRSWTHDSELSCAVLDDTPDLRDPRTTVTAFARSAAALDAWHAAGRHGQRPPGRLRTHQTPTVPWWTNAWATRYIGASMTLTGAQRRYGAPTPSDRPEQRVIDLARTAVR